MHLCHDIQHGKLGLTGGSDMGDISKQPRAVLDSVFDDMPFCLMVVVGLAFS